MKKPITVVRNELASILPQLEHDAARVLLAIAKRLQMGRAQYGALCIANDARDWTKEAHEEALDMSVYLAIASLAREQK
jgi:hypothetical protein